MDEPTKTPPVEPQDYLSGVNVVDFGELRVARGMSRRPFRTCNHTSMVYDPRERRIYCEECESDVEPFDAFMAIVERYDSALKKYRKIKDDAIAARAHNLHRIAAKKLEKLWRGKQLLPCCPHCSRGLLPSDMENPRSTSRVFELRLREKADTKPPSKSDE